jgi:hypothetical protein
VQYKGQQTLEEDSNQAISLHCDKPLELRTTYSGSYVHSLSLREHHETFKKQTIFKITKLYRKV